MRNLYKLLGITATASDADIRAAIARCENASVRQDATEVLLDPTSKQAYDRVYRLLADIGLIRANLGLNHATNWQEHDFTVNPTGVGSLRDALMRKIHASAPPSAARSPGRDDDILDFMAKILCAIVLAVLIGLLLESGTETGDNHAAGTTTPHPSELYRQREDLEALALPAHGQTWSHTPATRVAPLTINTSHGAHYFVKLVDAKTGAPVMEFFVHGGLSLQVQVPTGRFRIRYASGSAWFGTERLFGRETSYSEAQQDFSFEKTSRGVSGYTITLYQVANGNLRTKRLTPGTF